METLTIAVVALMALITLDILALRFGADSRDYKRAL